MSIYPIRMIYAIGQCDAASREPQAKIMVSVPKRYFKRAVKRNRVKRQLREAYRRNKHLLLDMLAQHPGTSAHSIHLDIGRTLRLGRHRKPHEEAACTARRENNSIAMSHSAS